MTDSVNLGNDFLLETPIPGVPLESILRTQELRERPSRSPDYETENRALVALANALADSPSTILQTLADRVLELLHADSAGLSLLTSDEKRFYWAAIAGAWRPHTGSNVPRNSCPCGEVLDRNIPMLFTHWERRYLNFGRTMPVTEEGLFVPFYANGKPVGTIWAFAHDNRRRFDAEDLRLLERTSRFASAACQVLASIENLKLEITAREKAETAVRELANGLETQVRVRTHELEGSTRDLLATNKQLQREIAERKLVEGRLRKEETELKRSEVRKGAIVDSALDCIVTIDHEGRITEFNPASEHTFGHRRDEVLGKHLADVIIPPSLREKHRQGFARYLATGEARVLGKRIEMTAVRADGSQFPVELAITRTPLEGPPTFTGYLRDITERKRAERELQRSEAFLAEAQHLSRTGSFSWRVAADEITWSAQLYRIWEFAPGVSVTLDLISTRIHPEDIRLFEDIIVRARADGRDFEYESRLLMPDRSVKYLHTAAHGTRDKDGRVEYIGAVQDVTQRRLAEEAVGKARTELANMARVTSLGVLTASIAHEVNQPLFGIMTNADTGLLMLSTDPPDVEGAREATQRTIRDANRASDVIKKLRALYSKKDPSPELMDLNQATREVISLSLSDLQRSRVILRQELDDDLPLLIADRVQVQQVIMNLVRNASDAMSNVDDRPRELLIRTEREEGDRVRLSVKDAGVGFEPLAVDRLFEAFYTTKDEGMGIGLSISHSIVEAHEGRLWATANDGPGATFSFSIPCRAAGLVAEEARRTLPDGAMDAA